MFSIIIPTFNREDFIGKAIQSVIDQTYTKWELIIIDDGSTDNTKDVVESFNDKRISYVYQENHGVAHARNRGIERAEQDWFVFLDSDDWFLPQKLERTIEYIEKHPEIKFFHTQERWFRQGQEFKQKYKHQNPDGWVYRDILPICCISASTVVIHYSLFDIVGIFDEEFDVCEDYDLWLRMTYQFEVKLIPEVLTEKDGGRDDQLSRARGMDRYRVKALCKMLDSGILNEADLDVTYEMMRGKAAIIIHGSRKRDDEEQAEYFEQLVRRYSAIDCNEID